MITEWGATATPVSLQHPKQRSPAARAAGVRLQAGERWLERGAMIAEWGATATSVSPQHPKR
jgi:hypothetical protein